MLLHVHIIVDIGRGREWECKRNARKTHWRFFNFLLRTQEDAMKKMEKRNTFKEALADAFTLSHEELMSHPIDPFVEKAFIFFEEVDSQLNKKTKTCNKKS